MLMADNVLVSGDKWTCPAAVKSSTPWRVRLVNCPNWALEVVYKLIAVLSYSAPSPENFLRSLHLSLSMYEYIAH